MRLTFILNGLILQLLVLLCDQSASFYSTGSLCLQHHFSMLFFPVFCGIYVIGWVSRSELRHIYLWQGKRYIRYKKGNKKEKENEGQWTEGKRGRKSMSVIVKSEIYCN